MNKGAHWTSKQLEAFEGKRPKIKAQWATIGGKRYYFRSQWEVDYAKYLDLLKQHGKIKEWEYEPETFWFETIKRGVRSYLPDFRVTETDGTVVLYEVKGYMDSRSKTKLKRMKKYYPDINLYLVQAPQIKEIRSKFSFLFK